MLMPHLLLPMLPAPQVKLTADYAPAKLMEFLTASQYYPLEGALAICQRRSMVAEQVLVATHSRAVAVCLGSLH